MSVEAQALVWNHSRAQGTQRLVLLAIANHEGEEGSWPSIQRLAKHAGVTVRNVQKAIQGLIAIGELDVVYQASKRRTNLFRVNLRCPADCDGTSWHRRRSDAVPAFEAVDNYAYAMLDARLRALGEGDVAGDTPVAGDTLTLSEATPWRVSEATPQLHKELQRTTIPVVPAVPKTARAGEARDSIARCPEGHLLNGGTYDGEVICARGHAADGRRLIA